MLKISLVQMNSQPDQRHNLAQAERLMGDAMRDRPDLIVLPEHFDWMGGNVEDRKRVAATLPGGDAYALVQNFARQNAVWIHAGSLLERDAEMDRVFNTSVVFDRRGEEVGTYRKIHLFDITAPDGKIYSESATVSPGKDLLIYELDGHRIACAICYDLRFSGLFDRLSREGVDIFILPAAFTDKTGRAHWEVLCRARAIEFQAYVVACGQCGSYPMPTGERRHTHGHSLVCDPWGRIIAHTGNTICVLDAEIDPARLVKARSLIPMGAHRIDMCERAVRVGAGRGS